MRCEHRDRAQRLVLAKRARNQANQAHGTHRILPSHRDYQTWSTEVDRIVDAIWERDAQDLLKVNLHPWSSFNNAAICRLCMKANTRKRYYLRSE
jgi:hypothetical protein